MLSTATFSLVLVHFLVYLYIYIYTYIYGIQNKKTNIQCFDCCPLQEVSMLHLKNVYIHFIQNCSQ